MAFRYRQRYFATDDALNIDDWNHNMKELAEEFNGYLDRDNFPNGSFGQAQIVDNAFNKVHYTTDASLTIDMTTTSWQSGSISDDIDCKFDCLLLIEFGCANDWSSGTPQEDDGIRHRVVMDGSVVAESGWYSSMHLQSCTFIAGAIPAAAGPHTIKHFVMVGKVSSSDNTQVSNTSSSNTAVLGSSQLLITERRR